MNMTIQQLLLSPVGGRLVQQIAAGNEKASAADILAAMSAAKNARPVDGKDAGVRGS